MLAQGGFKSRIWASKAPFSLTFHGRMIPLVVYLGRYRFGAPERAVSSRFEIDSGDGTGRGCCVRARMDARGCTRVCATGNRISAFVGAALERRR